MKNKVNILILTAILLLITCVYTYFYMSYRNKAEQHFDSSTLVIYHESGRGGFFNLFYRPAMFVDELITGYKVVVKSSW